MRFPIIITYLLLLTLFSCGESDSSTFVDGPSNLTIQLTVPENSRTVTIEATADNVVEYEFNLGDESEIISNASGLVEHTYSEGGNYSVEIKAVGDDGKFVRELRTVVIPDELDLGPIDGSGYTTPLTYAGLNLIWNDEFDGTTLNENNWNYEIGTGSNGWGNNELQYYREENTSLREGFLLIEAKNESFSNSRYTSSRLTTEGKFDFQYGRVDIRAKMPKGQGMWPALWMLGANFRSVGWPFCGEIDIMEMIGGTNNEDVVHGTAHWDASGTKADFGGSTRKSNGLLADEFHVYTIIWDENQIRWLFDDRQYHAMSITQADLSEFRDEFFFIFNVAVGGNWPGSPNSSTVFPQRMIVDYVRVFQDAN